MASKPKSALAAMASTVTSATPRTRTVKQKSEQQLALIASAKSALENARNISKEATALSRLIEGVSKLSEWGIGQLREVLAKRTVELHNTKADSELAAELAAAKSPTE